MLKVSSSSLSLFVGCAGVAGWFLLLQRAAAAVGSYGYYFDLAQKCSYFFAWLCIFFGLQVLVTSGKRLIGRREAELRIGVVLGLAPEITLAVPILLKTPIDSHQWLFSLARIVHNLQMPGRILTWPFGDFSRWAVGLTAPPTWWIAKELVVLNAANIIGWAVISLLLGVGIRRLLGGSGGSRRPF